jgi:hypothetical protein
MSERASAGLVLTATLSLVVLFLFINPFGWGRSALSYAFQAGPDSAKVTNFYKDPQTQETTNGEAPLSSLLRLTEVWRQCKNRVLLTGNSQTLSIVLAPGENRIPGPEKTYPDLVLDHYKKAGASICGYRLSAPNISYMEALWYLLYMSSHDDLKPVRFILQLNYETFRKMGVRDGMLGMLDDPGFQAAIQNEIASGKPYSATFEQALKRHEELSRKRGTKTQPPSHPNQVSETGVAESVGFGNRLEAGVRDVLQEVPGFQHRQQLKETLFDDLYLLRVYFLRITPTTRRAIGGPSFFSNMSSLERIAELCRSQRVDLVLFNAPQNPATPLYLNDDSRTSYEGMIRDFAQKNEVMLIDLEESIPGKYWGVWIDGPDPVHLGREGHRQMARLMIDSNIFVPNSQ